MDEEKERLAPLTAAFERDFKETYVNSSVVNFFEKIKSFFFFENYGLKMVKIELSTPFIEVMFEGNWFMFAMEYHSDGTAKWRFWEKEMLK